MTTIECRHRLGFIFASVARAAISVASGCATITGEETAESDLHAEDEVPGVRAQASESSFLYLLANNQSSNIECVGIK
jgi:hypothetical protein